MNIISRTDFQYLKILKKNLKNTTLQGKQYDCLKVKLNSWNEF